jgi:ubiquinone/menaquinone biosynthesis C-methylase UbiE
MKMNNPLYLRKHQYADPQNLNARILIHSHFSIGTESWADFIFRHLAIEGSMNILALGCGNATQWQINQDRFPSDTRITLTDLSMGMIHPAPPSLLKDHRFSFLCCDIQQTPFLDRYFDRVTANHMLYHVPDILTGLKEVSRVIKPEGIFMAATNGETHMIDLYELLEAFEPAYHPDDAKHTRFSIENGFEILKQVFSEVKFKTYESNLWVTDAQLLVDYVYSMWDAEEVIPDASRGEMNQYFQNMIDKDGGIFIRKSTGIFLASQSSKIINLI